MSGTNVFGGKYVVSRHRGASGGGDGDYDGSDAGRRHHHDGGADILLAVVVAVLILLIVLAVYCMFSAECLEEGLRRRGWVVYYATGCPHCERQKGLLRDFHSYIECGPVGGVAGRDAPLASPPCGSAAITAYPFWLNSLTGETKVGFQGVESLKRMARS
jgi:hypothetical protein